MLFSFCMAEFLSAGRPVTGYSALKNRLAEDSKIPLNSTGTIYIYDPGASAGQLFLFSSYHKIYIPKVINQYTVYKFTIIFAVGSWPDWCCRYVVTHVSDLELK